MRTLIVCLTNFGDPDEQVHLYYCEYDHSSGKTLESHFAAAFHEWYQTDSGKRFVDTNGTNWGDALDIDAAILARHGIQAYRNIEHGGHLEAVRFDHKMIVDHDDPIYYPESYDEND